MNAEQIIDAIRRAWLKRIRWDEVPRKSYAKQAPMEYVDDITLAPRCKCGALMRARAGYRMGGAHDWVAYECPRDNPLFPSKHTPWTTLHVRKIER